MRKLHNILNLFEAIPVSNLFDGHTTANYTIVECFMKLLNDMLRWPFCLKKRQSSGAKEKMFHAILVGRGLRKNCGKRH